jgi:hypothetical protein
VSLVENHVVPLLALEGVGILNHQLIRCDAHVKVIQFRPASSQLLACFGPSVVRQNLESRTPDAHKTGSKQPVQHENMCESSPSFEFGLPVYNATGGHHDKMGTPNALECCQKCK